MIRRGGRPRTKYKRSKNVFPVTSIALIIGRDWPRLVQPLAQSLICSPGTLSQSSQFSCTEITRYVYFSLI